MISGWILDPRQLQRPLTVTEAMLTESRTIGRYGSPPRFIVDVRGRYSNEQLKVAKSQRWCEPSKRGVHIALAITADVLTFHMLDFEDDRWYWRVSTSGHIQSKALAAASADLTQLLLATL